MGASSSFSKQIVEFVAIFPEDRRFFIAAILVRFCLGLDRKSVV